MNILKLVEKLGALFVMVASSWGWYRNWHTAIYEGWYYPKLSIVFPAFFIIAFATLVFPRSPLKREPLPEDLEPPPEDKSDLDALEYLTPLGWIVLVVALIAGFGNHYLISSLW